MAQPEDQIAIILEELRQDLTNTLTMLTIAIALQRNSAHLLQLLRAMLGELCEHIEQALPTVPPEEGERCRRSTSITSGGRPWHAHTHQLTHAIGTQAEVDGVSWDV
jgi:hypothetical protein